MKNEREFNFVNLSFYLDILYTSGLLFIFGFVGNREGGGFFLFLRFLGSLGLVASTVYWAMILYRLWKFAITESSQSGLKPSLESPGTAVGRLFIPGYNFYWIFICFRGLSRDLTSLASHRGISARLSTGFATTICIFCILGCVPFVNFIAMPITTFILLPVYIFKITTFARNLRIYTETGKNLFIAHGVTKQQMAAARRFMDIFPQSPSKYPVIAKVTVLALIWTGCIQFFAALINGCGFRPTFLISFLLAGLLLYMGYRFRSRVLTVGVWMVASGMVGVGGSFMMASYYGPSWVLHMGLRLASLLFGSFFLGFLFLMIRLFGVRWWGIFLAYAVSYILYSFTGEVLYRIPEFWRPGIWYILLGFGLVSAAHYYAFYFQIRMIIEDTLLKKES